MNNTHQLTLSDGTRYAGELSPDRAEFWSDLQISSQSIPCGQEGIWYATPLAELLIEQGALTLKPLS